MSCPVVLFIREPVFATLFYVMPLYALHLHKQSVSNLLHIACLYDISFSRTTSGTSLPTDCSLTTLLQLVFVKHLQCAGHRVNQLTRVVSWK